MKGTIKNHVYIIYIYISWMIPLAPVRSSRSLKGKGIGITYKTSDGAQVVMHEWEAVVQPNIFEKCPGACSKLDLCYLDVT